MILKGALVAVFCGLLACCSTPGKLKKRDIPVINQETVCRIRDSIRIRDSVVYLFIPREVVRVVCPKVDTLRMETSVASSVTWLDTTRRVLKGEIRNKPQGIKKEIQIVEKDKIITKEVKVEVPVPYEVVKEVTKIPKWTWWSLGVNVLFILGLVILLKLKS